MFFLYIAFKDKRNLSFSDISSTESTWEFVNMQTSGPFLQILILEIQETAF